MQLHATQPANIGPQDVPRTSPSNVPRTFPKDPFWPYRGRLDLTSWGRPNLTSWEHPEMTSRGRLNLMFKGRPWRVDSGRPQDVLRTFPSRPWEYSNFDIYNFFKLFFQNLFDWPNLKAFQHSRCIEDPVKLLRWRIFCKIS